MKARMRDNKGNITQNINEVYELEFYIDYGYKDPDDYEQMQGHHRLPVITKGSRDKISGCVWSWNGNIENPTLKPSIKTTTTRGDNREKIIMHCWLNNGKTQMINDSTIPNTGKTVDLVDLKEWEDIK